MPGGDFRMISCETSPDHEISGFFGLLLEFSITYTFSMSTESLRLIRPRIAPTLWLCTWPSVPTCTILPAFQVTQLRWVTALIFCYAPWYLPLTPMQPSSSGFLCAAKESLSCNPLWTLLSWYTSAWAPHHSAPRVTIIGVQDGGHQAPKDLQMSFEVSIVTSSALWLDNCEILCPLSIKRRF
jgi:hypothetical protein